MSVCEIYLTATHHANKILNITLTSWCSWNFPPPSFQWTFLHSTCMCANACVCVCVFARPFKRIWVTQVSSGSSCGRLTHSLKKWARTQVSDRTCVWNLPYLCTNLPAFPGLRPELHWSSLLPSSLWVLNDTVWWNNHIDIFDPLLNHLCLLLIILYTATQSVVLQKPCDLSSQ